MTALARAVRWLTALVVLLGAGGAVALFFMVRALIAPAPGEWSTQVSLGPLQVRVDVPTLVRLGTAPWLGPWLDGRSVTTARGRVSYHWQPQGPQVLLHCAPCELALPGAGAEHLRVDEFSATVRHQFGQLDGTVRVVQGNHSLHATWQGRLTQTGAALRLEAAEAPIAHWYAVWGAQIPELAWAEIRGQLGGTADIRLPAQQVTIRPVVSQFSVQGLSTEALATARTHCGPSAGLGPGSWLAKAVIAAEDQRFFEHPGYDLAELRQAQSLNQQRGSVVRGGSTLSQQLAKLLVTGDERSLSRKLRELLYATEMEQTLGKARILRLYLDNAPWGDGLCGAGAAARHYFGRPARDLTPAQAVWLASMLHNPGAEAQAWQATGAINLPRAQRIAAAVRGAPRAQRRHLIAALAEPPDWAVPAP
ncbi:MAG: transglycosylase domain-containing protein [Ramlibacter sp.]|nr:transglycosylase domain-containing protein [Ramlibacter sp.]